MEAVMFQTSPDQTLYPYKSHVGNSKRINFAPYNLQNMGLLQVPYSVQQPPLLPLPSYPPHVNSSSTNRTKSKSPTKKFNSNTPKKQVAKDHVKRALPTISSGKICSVNGSNDDDIRKNRAISIVKNEDEVYSGSVVLSISPPPSSLPLPNFCMRPKMMMRSCNAAGIDTGATDDLRRLLRIR